MKLIKYEGNGITNTQIGLLDIQLSGMKNPEQKVWSNICFADMFHTVPFESMYERYTKSGRPRTIKAIPRFTHLIHTPKNIDWMTDDILDSYLSICLSSMPDRILKHIVIDPMSDEEFVELFPDPDNEYLWINDSYTPIRDSDNFGVGRRKIHINGFDELSGNDIFYLLNLFRIPTEHPCVVGATVCLYEQVKDLPLFRNFHPEFIHPLTAYLYMVSSGHKIWNWTQIKSDWTSKIDTWNPWDILYQRSRGGEEGGYLPYLKSQRKMHNMEEALAIGTTYSTLAKSNRWDAPTNWKRLKLSLQNVVVCPDEEDEDYPSWDAAYRDYQPDVKDMEIVLE